MLDSSCFCSCSSVIVMVVVDVVAVASVVQLLLLIAVGTDRASNADADVFVVLVEAVEAITPGDGGAVLLGDESLSPPPRVFRTRMARRWWTSDDAGAAD